MSARDLQVRHGRMHARRPVGVLFKLLLAVVAVLAVSSTSVAAIAVAQTFGRLKPGIQLQTADGGQAEPVSVGAIEGGVNLLLVGTDTRTDQGAGFEDEANQDASSGVGNNDVTILLHISADHSNAAVISFPRDMMGPVPECPDPSGDGSTVDATDFAMFNTTLSRGGLSCTVLTVEALTGLKIPYAAEISFAGVSAMSTAVGGVTVCLASPVVDSFTGLDLEAGQQTLVGDEALAFVRTRHGVADGSDLGRISNQQVFLSALMRKVTSAGVLANPVTLYQLANAAGANMSLSTSLTNPNSMVSIALALKDVNLSSLVFVQYPVLPDPDDSNRVVADDSAAEILNTALVNDQPLTITGGTGEAAEADPNATPTDTALPTDAATAPATDGSVPSDAPVVTPTPTSVALPSNVTGQTAADETCTVGN